MKRLALLLALVGCIGLAVPASAHNLYRKPKVGVTGDVFKFRGKKWQPNAYVYWEYFARPRDSVAIQDGAIFTGPRGRFKLLFTDFNLGRHKMCFMQIDTRYARAAGRAPGDGRFFRKCKKYRVFGTDF
jgi:hypothetical protein